MNCGSQILNRLGEGLRKGERFRFGPVVVDDFGIQVPKEGLLRRKASRHYRWNEVRAIRTVGGLQIAMGGGQYNVDLPDHETDNMIVLEFALQMRANQPTERLSDTLAPQR